MLTITIPSREFYDESIEEFIYTKEQTLCLEHSLISISKWEARWKRAFLDDRKPKTAEENLDYIRCMTITQNVDPKVYYALTNDQIGQINKYIEDPMTATFISGQKKGRVAGHRRETVTSELIYWWMIAFQIPSRYERWHLNRLLTLIDVCDLKSSKPKKMTQREIMQRNKVLNDQRRRELNTRG